MIFVVAEHRQGQLREITREILYLANRIGTASGSEVGVLVLGDAPHTFAEELSPFCDQVLTVADDRLVDFNSEYYQSALEQLITEKRPRLILMGHTSMGMELAPYLAASLGLPLVTDCLSIEEAENGYMAVRKMYAGKIDCKTSISAGQAVATIRPGVHPEASKKTAGAEIEACDVSLDDVSARKRFIGYITKPTAGVDIGKADILVSAGRGLQEQEDLELLEELAQVLGGVVSCSRPIVDKGWLPHGRQVGTSGKVVKAKLYLAVGISGAYQHLGGMESCHTIVSINEDPNAPILSVADYAIIEDLYDIVPKLTEKLKALNN